MPDETRTLPLFPLDTVLFPGGTLPLHIFEPRYRAMTRACLAGDRRFGVLLIADGAEVGGPAVPHAVGTVARIVRAEPLDDGRFNLVATGEGRFSVVRTWIDPAGYLMGEVTARPEVIDEEPARLAALAAEARDTLDAYLARLIDDPAPAQAEVARLADPVLVAGLAASLLREDNAAKQRILEDDSAPTRLRRLHALLRRELALLDVLARPTEAALQRKIISPN